MGEPDGFCSQAAQIQALAPLGTSSVDLMGTKVSMSWFFVWETETVTAPSSALDVMLTGSAHLSHLGHIWHRVRLWELPAFSIF